SRQIRLMASAPGRSLSDFVSGVQLRQIKHALHHYTVDGPMGQLLDAEQDGLTLGTFQCFEIEELMNMGERNLGSGLIDQSQKMTVAARAMAERKAIGHLS